MSLRDEAYYQIASTDRRGHEYTSNGSPDQLDGWRTTMGTSGSNSTIPADVTADLERAVEMLMTGQRDPEFEERIHARAEKITQEILEKHGVLDIGVPAIRALRNGEDE